MLIQKVGCLNKQVPSGTNQKHREGHTEPHTLPGAPLPPTNLRDASLGPCMEVPEAGPAESGRPASPAPNSPPR